MAKIKYLSNGKASNYLDYIASYLKHKQKSGFNHWLYVYLNRLFLVTLARPAFWPQRRIPALLGFGTMPDFLIIGAQKAGTSSMYQFLIKQPTVREAIWKEPHFFVQNFSKGLRWYQSYFPPRFPWSTNFITGEASPSYLFVPYVPELISKNLPQSKFIVLLRNPIDRAFSHYNHCVTHRLESQSFEYAIECEDERISREINAFGNGNTIKNIVHSSFLNHSYVTRGIYITQLKKWLEVIPRERILILIYEDFFDNPEQHSSRVLNFLGISGLIDTQFPKRNIGVYSNTMREVTRQYLRSIYKPYNEELADFLHLDLSVWG